VSLDESKDNKMQLKSRQAQETSMPVRLAIFLLGLFFFYPLAFGAMVAEYRFDDLSWCSPASALDTVGTHHGTLVGSVLWKDSPAAAPKPVNGSAVGFSGGAIDITGLPLNLASGAQNSVSFWMFWDGTNSVMPLGFGLHDLWLYGGSFGFNTFNSDIYGISSTGLANGWHHVVAVFTNNNVTANKLWIDGVAQPLTQRRGTPNNANATANAHMRFSGVWGNSGYRFKGMLDVVRIYSGAITQTEVDADRALSSAAVVCAPPLPATLATQYRLDDNWEATHATANAVGGGPTGNFLSSYAGKVATPAVSPNKPDTCSGAAFIAGTGSMRSTGNTLNLAGGEKNSISFWMYWNGGDNQMPFGFARYDLWFRAGSFGFNTSNGDIYGIASSGLANGWHHVAAVFANGNVTSNKLWIDGVPRALTQRRNTPNSAYAYAANTFQLSGWTNDNNYRFNGTLDEVKVYRGELTDAEVLLDYAASCSTLSGPHHLEIQHPTGSGLTCAASTLTVRACADVACATPYTGGVSGTLAATGALTVNWDGTTGGSSGAGFVIAAGSSSVTKNVQVSTAGSVVFGTSAATPAPANATSCNFGSPTCTFTASTAGFVFSNSATGTAYSIPAQVSGVASAGLYLRALQTSTSNPAVCTPAIVSQTTPVNMGYACNNPASCQPGNLATVNATSIGPAGAPVSLSFDSNGSAPLTLRYDDVGQITFSASKAVTPFGGSTPVTLTGSSNALVVAPHHFGFSNVTAGPIKAGNNFSATVTAYNGLPTPTATANFGKETVPEQVTLGRVRYKPTWAGASDGVFSGSLGAFNLGAATASNLNWSEVGIIDLSATLASASYLGSGLSASGSTGSTGALGSDGLVVRFIPDHFDTVVSLTAGLPMPCPSGLTCPSQYNGFVYSGQGVPLTVTAKNGLAAPTTTVNYGYSATAGESFSKGVTLSAVNALGGAAIAVAAPGGTVSAATVLASSFSLGSALVYPVFAFTATPTAPADVYWRALDADGVSSLRAIPSSSVEGGSKVVSGRMRIPNAYGSERLALPITMTVQFYNGTYWLTSLSDSVTSFDSHLSIATPTPGNVVASILTGLGGGLTVSSPATAAVVAGLRTITLAAPNVSGSVNLTLNAPTYLPSSTARATFGIYKSPLIYRRENY